MRLVAHIGVRAATLGLAMLMSAVAISAPPLAPQPATQPVEQAPDPATSRPIEPDMRPALADAPDIERTTIEALLKDRAWPRRAIAAARLERFSCTTSRDQLIKLLDDKSWQVQAFALRSLARRRIPAEETWFVKAAEPRLLRCALRCRYTIPTERLQRAVRMLSKSSDLHDKMLAAELGAASNDADLKTTATEALRTIILRMTRPDAGALSPRLAALTGGKGMYRPFDWQQWLMKKGRKLELRSVWMIDDTTNPIEPSPLAALEPDQFCGLEQYIAKLSKRELDLCICLDCTASMGAQIAAAQGGIDDMMLFVGDVVSSLRVALVAYRDRSDEFETKACDFDPDISKLRQHLWQLSADGGGDEPEAVYPAMKLAMLQLHWRPDSTKVLVVVGDAPPHVGYGIQCVNLAQRGRDEAKLTTHMIQARGKDVKHFEEIAKAGGGRCVPLKESDALMAEITGLTLGDRYQDEFREFFQAYLELCR